MKNLIINKETIFQISEIYCLGQLEKLNRGKWKKKKRFRKDGMIKSLSVSNGGGGKRKDMREIAEIEQNQQDLTFVVEGGRRIED